MTSAETAYNYNVAHIAPWLSRTVETYFRVPECKLGNVVSMDYPELVPFDRGFAPAEVVLEAINATNILVANIGRAGGILTVYNIQREVIDAEDMKEKYTYVCYGPYDGTAGIHMYHGEVITYYGGKSKGFKQTCATDIPLWKMAEEYAQITSVTHD